MICFWIVVITSIGNRFLHVENSDPGKTILVPISPLKAEWRKLF